MQNYFNYFTEIEEHFSRRRGSILLLSTLDWATIEVWRDTGIPLTAVLRGIDSAFDKHDAVKNRRRTRRINSLAWCAQAVISAFEDSLEASIGTDITPATKTESESTGFEQDRIARHLVGCADTFRRATGPDTCLAYLEGLAARLHEVAEQIRLAPPKLDDLDRSLLVMDEKLFSTLLAAEPEADLVRLKEQAANELAPYRSRMQAVQIRQIEQQFLHKRLLDKYRLPRTSLFYMSQQ